MTLAALAALAVGCHPAGEARRPGAAQPGDEVIYSAALLVGREVMPAGPLDARGSQGQWRWKLVRRGG